MRPFLRLGGLRLNGFQINLAPDVKKPALQGWFSRNTYWFDGLCKSFHDRPYQDSTSSITAAYLESRCFG